jgi:hypothetical protein
MRRGKDPKALPASQETTLQVCCCSKATLNNIKVGDCWKLEHNAKLQRPFLSPSLLACKALRIPWALLLFSDTELNSPD